MSKEFKKLLVILAAILIVFYAFLIINNNGILLFWGDGADQYIQFVSYTYEMIRTGQISLWNSSIGLGANMFVMFFSVLGSPSFLFMLLAPNKEALVYMIAIVDIIRFVIVAILSYMWISKLVKNETARIVTSIVFTFSGWVLFWMHMPHFMDMFIYLALILYCLENIFENKKKILFSFSIAGLGILSIYQLYMMSWFILFYMLCRYFMIYERFDIKTFLPLLKRTLIHYLLGIGLGMVVILPSILILLSTNRIDSTGINLFSIITIKDILRTITSMISPISNDYDYNLYFGAISNGIGNGNTIYSYTSILFPLLLIQLLFIKFKGKKALLISSTIMYSLLLFKFSYFIFNGNMSIRWSFFYTVINCILLAYIFEYQKHWNKKALLASSIILIGSIIVLTLMSRSFDLVSIQNRMIQKYVIPCLIGFIILYILSFIKVRRLFYFVLVIEVLFCLFVRTFNGDRWVIDGGKNIDFYQSKIYFDEYISKIEQIEEPDSFYRMEIDSRDNLGYNLPLANQFNGFSFYVSVYNYYTAPLYENRFGNQWYNGYQPSKSLLKTVLGNKYIIQETEQMIPYGYSSVYIGDDNKYQVLENNLTFGLGYATNKLIAYESIKDKSIFEQDIAMLQGVVVDDQKASTSYQLPKSVDFDKDSKSFKPLKNFNGIYYLDYSLDDPQTSCKYEMYYDGNQFDTKNIYEVGYQELILEKEYKDIFAYCTSNNNANHYSNLNLYSISYKDLDKLYSYWKTQDQFQNVMYMDGLITATITITDTNKMAMTSIPYDPGWTVKVDGKETPIKIVNLGLIGFDLSEGVHSIEMIYTPPGLKIGVIISLISLMVLILIKLRKNEILGKEDIH
ncbi:MAG: YfhO family protein [Bacilli bacterium]